MGRMQVTLLRVAADTCQVICIWRNGLWADLNISKVYLFSLFLKLIDFEENLIANWKEERQKRLKGQIDILLKTEVLIQIIIHH